MSIDCPNVFLINLDRSPKRLQRSSEQLLSRGIKFERISAIDGNLQNYVISPHYDANANRSAYYECMSSCLIANFLSHRKAWKTIIDRKLSVAVILEDDFIASEDCKNAIIGISKIRFPYHIIKLFSNTAMAISKCTVDGTSHQIGVPKRMPTTTLAYAVSLEGARLLYAKTEKVHLPIDVYMKHWWEIGLISYSIYPNIFHIENCPSDISDRAPSAWPTKIKKIFYRWRYAFNFMIHGAIPRNNL
jgi:glycosyl transferase, family 25